VGIDDLGRGEDRRQILPQQDDFTLGDGDVLVGQDIRGGRLYIGLDYYLDGSGTAYNGGMGDDKIDGWEHLHPVVVVSLMQNSGETSSQWPINDVSILY
jgi:hypothetical protein